MTVKHESVDNMQSSKEFKMHFWLMKCALKSIPVACLGKLEMMLDGRKQKKKKRQKENKA